MAHSALCFFSLATMAIAGIHSEETIQAPPNLTYFSDQIQNSLEKVEWTEGIADWVPPEDMTRSLRYYISGYDYSHRPVIMVDFGHWDVKNWTADPATRKVFYKYCEQFWFRLRHFKSPFQDADEGVVLLMDTDGFEASQVSSIETIKFHLWTMRLGEKFENYIVDYILINVNFVGELWVNIIRPIAGKLVGKMETYGPNKDVWLAVLASKMPRDQIPSWYGGSAADYKPVQVWGWR